MIAPVSAWLYGTIRQPGPWYRLLFALHTIALVFAVWMAARVEKRWVQATLAATALLLLLPGLAKTRDLWSGMTASAEREGKFYLASPGKVLLSEQGAWWFIPGVHDMYSPGAPHYVLAKDLAATRIQPNTPLWAWRDGHFRPICTSSAESGSLSTCLR